MIKSLKIFPSVLRTFSKKINKPAQTIKKTNFKQGSEIGAMALRSQRRSTTTEVHQDLTQNQDPTQSEKMLTRVDIKPSQNQEYTDPALLSEEYGELTEAFNSVMSVFSDNKLFEAKKALQGILYKLGEKNLMKTELACYILEVLADINLKLRDYTEASTCFMNIHTIFSGTKPEDFPPIEDQATIIRDCNHISAQALYNSALVQLDVAPEETCNLINNQLSNDII